MLKIFVHTIKSIKLTMNTRKSIILALVLGTVFFMASSITSNNAHSFSSGAPTAKTGSPGDGSTCTSCHAGTASAQTGWITSNIPAGGYIPGTTYTITATATQTACTKFGFEISPQNASGTLLGTLIATNTTQTQLIGSGKYITHTSGGTSAVGGTKTWTFDWTAPTASTVTFYGAFNGSNSSGSSAGDIIYNSNLVVNKCTTLPAPTAITGNATVCVNSANNTYSIVAVAGATSYTWVLPSGWVGASTTTSITATAGTTGGDITVTANDACGASLPTTLTVVTSAITSVNLTKTNATCNGANNGTATATVVGGTAPYGYAWSPAGGTAATATGLTPNTYSVLVTDANGCTKSNSIIITEPLPLNASTTHTNVSCNGGTNGTATAIINGGTSGYSYSWNTSPVQITAVATNLPAGAYTVTITDANSCTTTALANITEPTVLGATNTHTNVLCKGGNSGTATAIASGGTTAYSYSWNTSPVQTTVTANNLPIGVYTATITDAKSCVTTTQVTITEPVMALTTNGTVTSNVLCKNGITGAAIVSAGGGTGAYIYNWNSSPVQTTANATGLSAGLYIATVTDANGCMDTSIITITEPPLLSPSITPSPAYCNGTATGTAAAENPGGTPPYTYSWNSSPVQTTAFASGLAVGTYTLTTTDSNGCVATTTTTITEPTALVAAATFVNALCKGDTSGTATATATGGSGAYSYSWNTTPVQTTSTALHLAAGTYTATVTDVNSCTSTATVTVGEPATLVSVTTSSTNSACTAPTGTLTGMGTGGTGTLTYSWNTSPVQNVANATSVTSGTYTCTVTDANGCKGKATATVTNPSGAVASITNTTTIVCNGGATGAATVGVTGGLAPYTYSWTTTPVQTTTTASNLTAGTYTCTITDANSCATTAIATVAQLAAVSGSVTKSNVLCFGAATGSATITGTGGTAPYSYSWNTSPTAQTTATISNLPAFTYTCTVTDANGCVGTKATTITQSTAITINKTKTDPSCGVCVDGAAGVIVSGGAAPYIYSWTTSPVQTTASVTGLAIGKYVVTITDANGCVKKDSVTLSQTTGLYKTATSNAYTIYPNPTKDKLIVAIELTYTTPLQLTITSLVGAKIMYTTTENTTGTYSQSIDVSNLTAGVYFITLQTNKEQLTKRFVKE